MSKLYGTLVADRGESTRCSNKVIRSSAQSYEGSIAVKLEYINNKLFVTLDIEDEESTAYPGTRVFDGPWEEALEVFNRLKKEREKI